MHFNIMIAHNEDYSVAIRTIQTKRQTALKASWLDTPLGPMIATSDEDGLYCLEFIDDEGEGGLEHELERLRLTTKAAVLPGVTEPINLITRELKAYFNGLLTEFKTPLHLAGSLFQKLVWAELVRIPYGQTRSYAAQAVALGKPTAYRAVANANGANPFAIIIPCHRVINSNGKLGGYAGGIAGKKWLLEHEQKHSQLQPTSQLTKQSKCLSLIKTPHIKTSSASS